MITVSILYPAQSGSRFDFDYYLAHHMPLARRLLSPALRGMKVEQGLAGAEPGSAAAFTALCHLHFDSVDAFLTAFQPVAAQLQGDIANYTDIAPQIQFSQVLLAE